jgi:hypothetical protein
LRSYQSLFQERTLSREAPPIIWGRDMKIARDLLKVYSYERLEDLLKQFFATHDAWFEQSGYSLPCFKNSIARLLLCEGRTMPSSGALPPSPHSSRAVSGATEPRRYTGWQHAADIPQSRTSQSYFLP